MLVTLWDGCSGAFSGARKNGSSLQDMSGAGWGREAGGGGAAACGGAAGLAGALKNWVKPPSAESEIPGEENPLARDDPEEGTDPTKVAEDGGAGRGGSSVLRGGVWGGVTPETKMRVNSPGGWSLGAGCGVGDEGALNTAVGASVAGWARGAGGGTGRGACELNIWVNSPWPPP
jgi:hypothetical protein